MYIEKTEFKNGDMDEFEKAFYALSYLCTKYSYKCIISFSSGTPIQSCIISSCDKNITSLVEEFLFLFDFKNYEVRKEIPEKYFSYETRFFINHLITINEFFPTARERLKIKAFLREILYKYHGNVALLDKTFP